MHSRLGYDHPAITVADQYTRTCLIENAARRSHVCRETRLRLLNNSHRVTMTLENVRHRLPSGTVGEGAVDQNDSLDGRVRRGGRHKSGAHDESQYQAFHGAAPLTLLLTTVACVAYCTRRAREVRDARAFRLIAVTHVAHQPEKDAAVDGRAPARGECSSRPLDRYPFTLYCGRAYEAECLYLVCRLT